jgi:hypothetical protein
MGNSQNTKPSPIQHICVGFGQVLEVGVSPISELKAMVTARRNGSANLNVYHPQNHL